MNRLIAPCLLSLLLVGCGDDRPTPVEVAPLTAAIAAPKDKIFDATVRELTSEGFTVSTVDRATGIISTAPKVVKLTNEDATCPGSMGVNLTNEPRTVIHLTWSAIADESKLTLRPAIEYAYLPGDAAFGRQGSGQSTGKLERELAAKISKALLAP